MRATILAGVFLSVLLSPPCCGVQAARPDTQAGHAQYSRAVSLLGGGRSYVEAAALLSEAITKDPHNSQYHLALGCAYADRMTSIAYAQMWKDMMGQFRKQYPDDLAKWEVDQSNPKSSDYHQLPPTLPAKTVFRTKDDNNPQVLTDAQAASRINKLGSLAQLEWHTALSLSRAGSQKAESEYVCAWGLELLIRAQRFEGESPAVPGLAVIGKDSVEPYRLMMAAVGADPRNATKWQSLGDLIYFDRGGELGVLLDSMSKAAPGLKELLPHSYSTAGPQNSDTVMLDAYARSLAVAPNNAALWYRLYRHATDSAQASATVPSSYLRFAIKADPDIAFLHYTNAYLIITPTHYADVLNGSNASLDDLIAKVSSESTAMDKNAAENAIAEIERGDRCRLYAVPRYVSPLPPLLAPAWNYWDRADLAGAADDFPVYARMRGLARALVGYAYVAAYQHDETRATRSFQAVIGMGNKMGGAWPVRDSRLASGDVMLGLVASAILAIGYAGQDRTYKQLGDSAFVARATEQHQNFKRRNEAYRAAVTRNFGTSTLYQSMGSYY